MLVFSQFFFVGLWVYFWNKENLKTNILLFSLLQSCKYDDFCCLFNVAKKQRCDTVLYLIGFNFFFIFLWTTQRKMHKIILEDVWIYIYFRSPLFSVASVQLAISHFGTRETLGCSRVDKSQKVKLRHSRGNSTRSGETPLTIVKTRVGR